MVGLLLIALGTGGIKPCVAAFGGDQFEDHQVRCTFIFKPASETLTAATVSDPSTCARLHVPAGVGHDPVRHECMHTARVWGTQQLTA